MESLCSSKLDGFIRKSDIKRLPWGLQATMRMIFVRFCRIVDTNEVSFCSDDQDKNALSLLDFIVAIHEMSNAIDLEQLLQQAFELLGGTEEHGLSVQQLHRGI